MRALLCGVRGSTPASGAEYVDVGGNTSCVAIPAADGRWLVLDAGTGFTVLATELGGDALRGSILLTHLHWDHTHGLPFLPNADRPDAEVDLWMPEPSDGADPADAVAVLSRAMSPPHFPIGPEDLQGRWRFRAIAPGRHEIEGFDVTTAEVHHKGGRTLGFRIESAGDSLAYLPDHCPHLASERQLLTAVALIEGVDVLLHGAGFLACERRLADTYGHATIDDAIELATAASVARLVVVHHHPTRTDAAVAGIEHSLRAETRGIRVDVGREGDWIQCQPPGKPMAADLAPTS